MLYVLVAATSVANIYKSRLKSLLQLHREVYAVGRNGTASNPSSLRLRASAVNHELRRRQAGNNEFASPASVILVR